MHIFAVLAVAAALAPISVDVAYAAHLVGYVDSLTAAGAVGWACVPGVTTEINIQVNAGATPLGIYPTTVARPDVASQCAGAGAGPHGFAIGFDPTTRAQLAGQTQISVTAAALGVPLLRLHPSTPHAVNPLPLPVGTLLGVDESGLVGGDIQSLASSAVLRLFAGGPAGQGVSGPPGAAAPFPGGGLGFKLQIPGVMPLPAPLEPVFAATNDSFGMWVPFANPLVLEASAYGGPPGAAANLPISATVAQSGKASGITVSIFSRWAPAGLGIAGVTGNVTLSGNDASFSEALVMVGSTADNQATCAQRNATTATAPPSMTQAWAAILKSNAPGPVSEPADVALPFTVGGPRTSAGTCVLTVINAGYANLDPAHARYATTSANLAAIVAPPVSAATVAIAMGFEARVPAGTSAVTMFEGFKADRPLSVAGISATVSAAAVVGGPPGGGWTPVPSAGWGVSTNFTYLAAAACAAGGFDFHASNGPFSTVRMVVPSVIPIPQDAVLAMQLPMMSNATLAVQRSAYKAFLSGTAFDGTMAVGDCLIAYETVFPGLNAIRGVIDLENQSVAYVHEEE